MSASTNPLCDNQLLGQKYWLKPECTLCEEVDDLFCAVMNHVQELVLVRRFAKR